MGKSKEKLPIEELMSSPLGTFTPEILHTLNNSLTLINNNSKLLIDLCKRGRNKDDFIDIKQVKKEKEVIGKIIEEIADASKKAMELIDNIKIFLSLKEIKFENIELNSFLYSMEKRILSIISENITMEFKLSNDLLDVLIDPKLLTYTILGIIGFSKKKMEKGGKITLKSKIKEITPFSPLLGKIEKGIYAVITISDTNSELKQPFHSNLLKYIKMMNENQGKMIISFEEGKGNVFSLFFKINNEKIKGKVGELEGIVSVTGTNSILVVEDEEMIKTLIERVLKSEGYKTTVFTNPDDALEIVKKSPKDFDLLITDVIMPGKSGKELYGQISLLNPSIPVLYMSGYSRNILEKYDLFQEGTHFLAKPFTIEEFLKKIKFILSNLPNAI
ncbi:MAG: response regulator [Promethearchaeota archaeon]